MKDARNQSNKQSKQMKSNRPTPEIRDNLDSREGLELNDRPGGHNKKETKAEKKKHTR